MHPVRFVFRALSFIFIFVIVFIIYNDKKICDNRGAHQYFYFEESKAKQSTASGGTWGASPTECIKNSLDDDMLSLMILGISALFCIIIDYNTRWNQIRGSRANAYIQNV